MTRKEIWEETWQRLAAIHADLANDQEEVERQLPYVRDTLADEADAAERHYRKIAEEGITPRYKDMYKDHAEKWKAKAAAIRSTKI